MLRLQLPGPRDALAVLAAAQALTEQALSALPRVLALLDAAERLLPRVDALITRIESTREAADAVVARTDGVITSVDRLIVRVAGTVGSVEPTIDRAQRLLDDFAPSLEKLRPTLERLAETTDPAEVDALVQLVDHLPLLVDKIEDHVLPMLESLQSVGPDIHDLLDATREVNEMLGKIPGMGRIRARVEEKQAAKSS